MAQRLKKWFFRALLADLLFLIFFLAFGRGSLDLGKEAVLVDLYGSCRELSFGVFLQNVMLHIAPLVLCIYAFSPYFMEEFQISFVYVFTRMNSRRRWLQRRTGALCLEAAGAGAFFLFTAYICAGVLLGNWEFSLGVMGELWLNLMLTLLPLLLLANVVSLWQGAFYGFLIACAVHILSFLAGMAAAKAEGLNTAVFLLLPTLNGMGLLRGGGSLALRGFDAEAGAVQVIPGFALWKSVLSCLLESGLIYGCAAWKLNRCDLLSVGKDGV